MELSAFSCQRGEEEDNKVEEMKGKGRLRKERGEGTAPKGGWVYPP